ncbi:hypothetical protein NIES3974_08460 [Calothrix sp. NIES-3974]|nr:hypothetical protein NIES3974_08460 [Calothrix sp. NIES-3974]
MHLLPSFSELVLEGIFVTKSANKYSNPKSVVHATHFQELISGAPASTNHLGLL